MRIHLPGFLRWTPLLPVLAAATLLGCAEENPLVAVPPRLVTAGMAPVLSPTQVQAVVVVLVDGVPSEEAIVRVNGQILRPTAEVFSGVIAGSSGDALTLGVTVAQGEATLRAVIPGSANLVSPSREEFLDNEDVFVTWTRTVHAETYIVVYYRSDQDQDPWVHQTTGLSATIPAAATRVGTGHIELYAANGEGTLRLALDPDDSFTADGFYSFTRDEVTIRIGYPPTKGLWASRTAS